MTDRCAGTHLTGVRRGVLTTMALSAVVAVSAGLMWRRVTTRRARNSAGSLHEVVQECEMASASVLELIERCDAERWEAGGRRLHASLVALEQRIGHVSRAASDDQGRRSLDELAGALISLRGALEADVRLHLDATTPPSLLEAGDDVLLVRCEDLTMSARALGDVRA